MVTHNSLHEGKIKLVVNSKLLQLQLIQNSTYISLVGNLPRNFSHTFQDFGGEIYLCFPSIYRVGTPFALQNSPFPEIFNGFPEQKFKFCAIKISMGHDQL